MGRFLFVSPMGRESALAPARTGRPRTIERLRMRRRRKYHRAVTEINGLRLAYRGLVTGLAAGWVWAATAMLGGLLSGSQPLLPLELLGGGGGRDELALGIAIALLASGGIGMTFAYFFARFFTVRPTLAVAAPCFAVLAWLVLGQPTEHSATTNVVLLAASLLYGIMLGASVPVRGDLLRSRGAASQGAASQGAAS
jgi:hypothetical protein